MDVASRSLAGAQPGERWVIRHRLPDGSATDVIGWIITVGPAEVEVSGSATAPTQRLDIRTVIAARRVPAAAGGRNPLRATAAEAERIALRGWLAEHEPLGEWTLRSAAGFTARANSCLAVGDPGVGYPEAAARIRRYAADRGIPPWAQVVFGSAEDRGLRDLGWRPTYVAVEFLVVRLTDLLGEGPADSAVSVGDDLTQEWLAAYHRSRPNDADPRLLRMILDGQPPRGFAGAADASGLFAIGRGHLERDWLGLASIWTRPDRRRQGWGTAIVVSLGHWAARRGARYGYLQVETENAAALRAYEALGFRRHHRYGYLAAPPG